MRTQSGIEKHRTYPQSSKEQQLGGETQHFFFPFKFQTLPQEKRLCGGLFQRGTSLLDALWNLL